MFTSACQQKEEAIKKEDEVIVPTTTTQVNKEEFTTQHVDEVAKEIINKCSVFEDVEKEEEEDDDIKYATPSEEPESETTQQQTQIINSITSHFQTSKNVEMSNNNVAVPNKSIKPINSNLLDNTTAKDESTITNNYTTTSKPLNNISTSFTLTSNNNKNHTTTITNYLPIMMNKPTTTTAATPTPQRRVYSREFLLSLRNHPQCNRQVDFQSPDMTEIIRRVCCFLNFYCLVYVPIVINHLLVAMLYENKLKQLFSLKYLFSTCPCHGTIHTHVPHHHRTRQATWACTHTPYTEPCSSTS